jgi:hypothetical protein
MNATTQATKQTLVLTSVARATAERTIALAESARIAAMIAETLTTAGRK